MNQHVDRRALLTSSAIATAAIAAASQDASAGTSATGVSPELEGLIGAKHAAYARFEAAIDRATPLEDAYEKKELYVPLSIGGGQSRHVASYSSLDEVAADLREDVKRRYREQSQKMAVLAKLSPDLARQSDKALRKAERADLKGLARIIDAERARREAAGVEQAVAERDEASEAERNSINAVCAYRCTSMEEHRVKAEFLMEFCTGRYGDLQPEDIDALLWSFLPVQALEGAVKASEGDAS